MSDPRTRAWAQDGSSTIIQFRTDRDPMVWMNNNLGWIPIGNTPKDEAKAESWAENIAESYGLEEVPLARAEWLAGWDEVESDEDR